MTEDSDKNHAAAQSPPSTVPITAAANYCKLLGFVRAVYGQHWCCARVSHARGNRAPAWQMPLGDQCMGKGHTQGQNK